MNSRDQLAKKICWSKGKFLKQICAFPQKVILLGLVSGRKKKKKKQATFHSPAAALTSTETLFLIPQPVLTRAPLQGRLPNIRRWTEMQHKYLCCSMRQKVRSSKAPGFIKRERCTLPSAPIAWFPFPSASPQEAEAPAGVGRAHCPAAGRARGLWPQQRALAHAFELSFFPMGCKHRSRHPSQKVRTQGNLLSVRPAFRRAGSAAESTFNLLSNCIMEQGTNYCLFPALLEASFTGFILPSNHFSSAAQSFS